MQILLFPGAECSCVVGRRAGRLDWRGGGVAHKQKAGTPGETVALSVSRQEGEGDDSQCPPPSDTPLPLAVTLPQR